MKKLILLLLVMYGRLHAQCSITITGNNTSGCGIVCPLLTANGANSYTWMPGGVTTPTLMVCTGSSTIYTVTGSTGTCTATQTVAVTVYPQPVASFTYGLSSCCNQGFFTDSSKVTGGSSIVGWNWTFDIGSPATSTAQNPSVYLNFGVDTVCLKVTTSDGCVDSTCQLVNETIMEIKGLDPTVPVLYPIPSNGELHVTTDLSKQPEVYLYNANGACVFSKKLNDNSVLDLSFLPNAVYTVTIKNTEGIIKRKLVLMR